MGQAYKSARVSARASWKQADYHPRENRKMRLWSFGTVHAERAHFGSAFARATADACAHHHGQGKGPMPHRPRQGGVTWEFSDQELTFLGVPHTSKGMKSASMRWQAINASALRSSAPTIG
jgi:hypothetical protein